MQARQFAVGLSVKVERSLVGPLFPYWDLALHNGGMERLLFAILIVLVWWAFDVTTYDGVHTSELLKCLHAAWADTWNIVARLRR